MLRIFAVRLSVGHGAKLRDLAGRRLYRHIHCAMIGVATGSRHLDEQRTLQEIAYYEDSNQIAINNVDAIAKLLSFIESYEVG